MRKYRMAVSKDSVKCTDSEGAWDGTWDVWYEYIIFNTEGEIVDQDSGYHTADKAKMAGEKRLKQLEDRL